MQSAVADPPVLHFGIVQTADDVQTVDAQAQAAVDVQIPSDARSVAVDDVQIASAVRTDAGLVPSAAYVHNAVAPQTAAVVRSIGGGQTAVAALVTMPTAHPC